MNDSRFNSMFRRLLSRTATENDKEELRRLWGSETGNPDPDTLFPYPEWQDTVGEEKLPELLQQKTLHYILSKDAPTAINHPEKRSIAWRWIPAAAILLLIMTGYLMWQNNLRKEPALHVITTISGERKLLTLADGSRVYLNGGSALHFPEQFGRQRIVRLEGEAFFEINRDSTRPFVVQTGNISTTVLGTSFNIAAEKEHTGVIVSVKTGKVQVAVNNNGHTKPETVQLRPGMQAIYNEQQNQLSVSDIPIANAGSWKDNLLVFDNASLEEICLALERKYGVHFVPSTPLLLHCKYSVRFNGLTLPESIDKLTMLGDLHFSRKDSVITIKGTPCIP